MEYIRFEWNKIKANVNARKHGVTFEEAMSVFDDENAVLFSDPDHSSDEDRFLLLGMSLEDNLLVVCHCVRYEDEVIRIISARKATRNETNQYAEIRKEW